MLPEDKYKLVKAFQKGGHIVGMCGDGANDAPALRQAQIGIAVSTATDVAKSAAGMVLTEPGLAGIVAAVKEGRMTFQRILTYTLNSITKKIVQVLFLAVGLVMTGQADPDAAADGPHHDHRRFPRHVDDDRQRTTVADAQCLAHRQSDDCRRGHGSRRAGLLYIGSGLRRLPDGLRHRNAADTGLCRIVFGNQATTYNNRERRRLWSSRPSCWLIASSVADIRSPRHWPSVESR